MSIFDTIFDAVKEEASLIREIVKYQAPIAADAMKQEASELKNRVLTQAPVVKETVSKEVSGLRQKAAEIMPDAKQALREGAATVRREFTGETVEDEAADEQSAAADEQTAAAETVSGEQKAENPTASEELLDDASFIGQLKHYSNGPWQQYDVLLAARGYGWDYMLDSAAYMLQADIRDVSTITFTDLGTAEKDVISSLRFYSNIKEIPDLKAERSTLAVGGNSAALGCPTKIVWFNQTQTLRIFTLGMEDENTAEKYAETLIRRTFGTKDAMKKAKPVTA